jgi:hypothetical protein
MIELCLIIYTTFSAWLAGQTGEEQRVLVTDARVQVKKVRQDFKERQDNIRSN